MNHKNSMKKNEKIVEVSLAPFDDLDILKDTLMEIIATLKNDFIKEDICNAAIKLIQSRATYELDMLRLKNFVASKTSSCPRSLRVKTKIKSRPDIMRSQEFRAIEEAALADDAKWQNAYWNHFRKVKELERNASRKIHTDNFFKVTASLIKTKSIFDLESLLPSLKKKFNNSNQLLTATAWQHIFNELDTGNSNRTAKGKDTSTAITSTNAVNSAIEAESQHTNSDTTNGNEINPDTTTEKEVEEVEIVVLPPPIMYHKHWLHNVSTYANVSVDDIIVKSSESFNMKEAKITLAKAKSNNDDMLSVILNLSKFISTFFPLITSFTIESYNTEMRLKRAEETAKSSRDQDIIESTTDTVAKALSNEASIPCKHMKDLIGKECLKNLKKSPKNSKADKKVTFVKGPNTSSKKGPHTKHNYHSSPNSSNKKRRKSPQSQNPSIKKKKQFIKKRRDLSGNVNGKKRNSQKFGKNTHPKKREKESQDE